jgi:hypothetical protein
VTGKRNDGAFRVTGTLSQNEEQERTGTFQEMVVERSLSKLGTLTLRKSRRRAAVVWTPRWDDASSGHRVWMLCRAGTRWDDASAGGRAAIVQPPRWDRPPPPNSFAAALEITDRSRWNSLKRKGKRKGRGMGRGID